MEGRDNRSDSIDNKLLPWFKKCFIERKTLRACCHKVWRDDQSHLRANKEKAFIGIDKIPLIPDIKSSLIERATTQRA